MDNPRRSQPFKVLEGTRPDAIIVGPERALVPPGSYEAAFLYHETNNITFGVPKVYLIFQLVDPGVMGITLFKACNCHSLLGKPGRNGRFKLTRRHDLTLLLCELDPTMRLDRIRTDVLREGTWKVEVETVAKNYRQRVLPAQLQYSVIRRIVGRIDGPSAL